MGSGRDANPVSLTYNGRVRYHVQQSKCRAIAVALKTSRVSLLLGLMACRHFSSSADESIKLGIVHNQFLKAFVAVPESANISVAPKVNFRNRFGALYLMANTGTSSIDDTSARARSSHALCSNVHHEKRRGRVSQRDALLHTLVSLPIFVRECG